MKITGLNRKDAFFNVIWPNGFDEDPAISVNGLNFDSEGDEVDIREILKVLGEYLIDHCNELKKRSAEISSGFIEQDNYKRTGFLLDQDYNPLKLSTFSIKPVKK